MDTSLLAYLSAVAQTLNDLAFVDRAQNRMEAARKEYEEALNIRRQFAKINPRTYLSDGAETLNNLAILDFDASAEGSP